MADDALSIVNVRISMLTMTSANLILPEELRVFADGRAAAAGYRNTSEYLQDLIRRDRDQLQFRDHLLEGARAESAGPMDADYFAELRRRSAAGSTPAA